MNTTTTQTVTTVAFGPLTAEQEAAFAPWTQEEKIFGRYCRAYRDVFLTKVGLGRVWYVSLADGRRYCAQFRTAREAATWYDSGMRLDWVAMFHGRETN